MDKVIIIIHSGEYASDTTIRSINDILVQHGLNPGNVKVIQMDSEELLKQAVAKVVTEAPTKDTAVHHAAVYFGQIFASHLQVPTINLQLLNIAIIRELDRCQFQKDEKLINAVKILTESSIPAPLAKKYNITSGVVELLKTITKLNLF